MRCVGSVMLKFTPPTSSPASTSASFSTLSLSSNLPKCDICQGNRCTLRLSAFNVSQEPRWTKNRAWFNQTELNGFHLKLWLKYIDELVEQDHLCLQSSIIK